jgi:hypothetical protein
MSQANKVVYTAVFDNYDKLLDPVNPSDEVDYICFTDEKTEINSDVWETRIFDSDLPPNLKNRKVKILAHEYLSEYEYSLYVDGNISIKKNIHTLLERLKQYRMAVPKHPERSCIYDEAKEVVSQGRADSEEVRSQIERYKEGGFPKEYGLSANRVVLRRHRDSDVIDLMEDWWEEMQQGAERDQLSFSYVAWKNNFDFTFIDENPSSETCEFFDLMPHRPSGFEGVLFDYWIPIYARRNKNRFYKAIYPPFTALKILISEGPKAMANSVKIKFIHQENETEN